MATEIARQEMDGRASAVRENKGECTNDDEDTRTPRQIMMLNNELIIFLS
jgi:hypothetical protein